METALIIVSVREAGGNHHALRHGPGGVPADSKAEPRGVPVVHGVRGALVFPLFVSGELLFFLFTYGQLE